MAKVQKASSTNGKSTAPQAPISDQSHEPSHPQLTPVSPRSGPTTEQISRRAYELFLARGSEHGHSDEDWIQAERELKLGLYQ